MIVKCIVVAFLCYNYIGGVQCTLSPKSPKTKKTVELKVKSGPQDYSVFDKDLICKEPLYKDILIYNKAYYRDTNPRQTDGIVLGYVTPWNNHGYDVAKIFANKFSHISPVWLQIKRKGDLLYEVTGVHDVDEEWMTDVKKAGEMRGTKIVPRILFDGWSPKDFSSLLTSSKEMSSLSEAFIVTCKKYKFDGLVIEVWLQLAGRIQYELLINLLKKIAQDLSKHDLDTIIVVPPHRDGQGGEFASEHLEELYDHVTGFSLMTYDYSNLHRPGANAPLDWVADCIKFLSPQSKFRDKILTGLNFYGYAYTPSGGGPIVGHEYLDFLKDYRGRLLFDGKSGENYFEVKRSNGKSFIFYPTLNSINSRILLARDLETGLSIWELGQGLDYFYDLL